MNDRSAPGRSIPGRKVGSDLKDTGNDAGSYLDGRDDEAPCPRFRPRSLDDDRRATHRGTTTPIRMSLGPFGGGDWSP
jgi:hypothetical protein